MHVNILFTGLDSLANLFRKLLIVICWLTNRYKVWQVEVILGVAVGLEEAARGKRLHTRNHKREIPLENATGNPLGKHFWCAIFCP